MNIHPDCFKVVDNRIDMVLTGRMSLEAFAVTIGRKDPFVLIGDTLYALSEDEFYSTRQLRRLMDAQEQAFKYVLSLEDLSFMQQHHRDFVNQVKKELPTCPVCKYKRYKEAIQRVAEFYKLPVQYSMKTLIDDVTYPDCKEKIASTVTGLLDKLYGDLPKQNRLPCMDCVEKHVAQAYILACESQMGYPEHRVLMCGHLAEAIDEAPKEFAKLRESLQMCMATTMRTGEAFLPLYLLIEEIQLARKALHSPDSNIETRQENPTVTDTIDITDDIKRELDGLPLQMRTKVYSACSAIRDSILEYKISRREVSRFAFEGLIACLADQVVFYAPLFANMLRNRRLMFVADPSYAADAGYTFDDVLNALTGSAGDSDSRPE